MQPFTAEDAEIFAKLQRAEEIKKALTLIDSPSFPLGLLLAESGCGKTSYLQAGILPELSQPESSILGIYIKISDRDPIETIRQVLIKELKLVEKQVIQLDFTVFVSQTVQAASKPIILLLDQFEQFFLHFKEEQERKPFIQTLAKWYPNSESLQVKILFSIRSDLLHHMEDFREVLDYSLSYLEKIRLKKLQLKEAIQILKIIAETEEIKFSEKSLQQIAEKELNLNLQ